jgi:hypothetical protein
MSGVPERGAALIHARKFSPISTRALNLSFMALPIHGNPGRAGRRASGSILRDGAAAARQVGPRRMPIGVLSRRAARGRAQRERPPLARPSGLGLMKSAEPVKIVDAPKSKKDAVLVITELTAEGDKATVRYRYDVEGIRATVTLAKSAHGWELKNSRLVEH